jgi:CRISPR-associated endonuclease/helicase Cas3
MRRGIMLPGDMDSPSSQSASFLAHLQDGRHQLVQDHLLSVGQIARTYSGKVGAQVAGATIGLLHDIGKYSCAFQHYLEQLSSTQDTEQLASGRGTVDHSTAGAQTIWRRLRLQGPREAVVGEILAMCVASHHSGLIDCITPSGEDNLSRRMRKADADSHFEEVWRNAEASVRERSEQLLQDPQLAKGISDIITNICQTDKNENLRRFKVGLLTRFLFSCLIDADRTDTADSAQPIPAAFRQHGQYIQWPVLADLLERKLEQFPSSSAVDLLRKQVSGDCLSASGRPKGIYTLTVPTGGGKTLASLRFALNHAAKWGMDRVIYISPYTSIIDQNADVVRRILEPAGATFASVVLEHHSNLTPVEQTWRSKILSDNWDAPVVFTTAVQLMEALFGSRTRAVRRMHQMANAVLIFDEIQTLPVRCVHIFNNAINFLREQCGSSVVLCTATQPLLHLVDESKGAIHLSNSSELMPDISDLFSTLRRHVTYDRRKAGGWEHAEAAALATSETERARSCLVVVNTKREARSIFAECKAASKIPIFHLSTGMCPAHRLDQLETIKAKLLDCAPVICVSTQLIEAGVDISFGSAIRALAGLDSIAQTAGRCNRHGGPTLGHVHVVNLKDDLPKLLADIRIAQEAAQRVLDENVTGDRTIDLDDPKLIEQYFRYSFFEHRQEMDYPVRPDKAERDDTLLNMLGANQQAVESCNPRPQIYLHQAFMTAANPFQAIDRVAQGVIVPYTSAGKDAINDLCAAHEPEKQFELLRRAQRFTVNVFPNVLRNLQQAGALYEAREGTGILCLRARYYNSEFGLNEKGTEEMETEFG